MLSERFSTYSRSYLYLYGYGQLVPAVDLRPAGDARPHAVDPGLFPRGDEVVLVVERRARADNGHIALQHVEKLRQLVQARTAQESAHGRYVAPRVAQQVGGGIARGICAHGAELINRKKPPAAADRRFWKQRRPGRGDFDRRRQDNIQRRQAHKRQTATKQKSAPRFT